MIIKTIFSTLNELLLLPKLNSHILLLVIIHHILSIKQIEQLAEQKPTRYPCIFLGLYYLYNTYITLHALEYKCRKLPLRWPRQIIAHCVLSLLTYSQRTLVSTFNIQTDRRLLLLFVYSVTDLSAHYTLYYWLGKIQ